MSQIRGRITRNIKYYREKAGMTQQEVAGAIGARSTAVASWENGLSLPDLERTLLLCRLFGVTLSEISGQTLGDSVLTADERELLANFGQCSDQLRETLLDYAYFCAQLSVKGFSRPRRKGGEGQPSARKERGRQLPFFFSPASAGAPLPVANEDYTLIDAGMAPEQADMAVRLSGESMLPDYRDGDIVWVKRQEYLEVGQVGVFVINGDAVCKKLGREALLSLNRRYPDLPLNEGDSLRVVGRVVGVLEGSAPGGDVVPAERDPE